LMKHFCISYNHTFEILEISGSVYETVGILKRIC
jgi:hypothetical protein